MSSKYKLLLVNPRALGIGFTIFEWWIKTHRCVVFWFIHGFEVIIVNYKFVLVVEFDCLADLKYKAMVIESFLLRLFLLFLFDLVFVV